MLALCEDEARYEVALYCNDTYVGSFYFTNYEDGLETAYAWQSYDCDTHISRLFEVDSFPSVRKELDL